MSAPACTNDQGGRLALHLAERNILSGVSRPVNVPHKPYDLERTKYGNGWLVKICQISLHRIHSRPTLNRIILKRIDIKLPSALMLHVETGIKGNFEYQDMLVHNSPVYCRINDAGDGGLGEVGKKWASLRKYKSLGAYFATWPQSTDHPHSQHSSGSPWVFCIPMFIRIIYDH